METFSRIIFALIAIFFAFHFGRLSAEKKELLKQYNELKIKIERIEKAIDHAGLWPAEMMIE